MDAILGALKSKTMWTAVILAVVTAVAQPVQDFITAHPGGAGALASFLMAGLRAFTTDSLASKGSTGTGG